MKMRAYTANRTRCDEEGVVVHENEGIHSAKVEKVNRLIGVGAHENEGIHSGCSLSIS